MTKAFSQNVSCTTGGAPVYAAVPSSAAVDVTHEQDDTNLIQQLINKNSLKLLRKSESLNMQRISNEVSVDMMGITWTIYQIPAIYIYIYKRNLDIVSNIILLLLD